MNKALIDPSPARAAAYVALYPMLNQIARRHGYALAVHGSLHKDFDLIAVPWIEEASDALTLIRAFKKATRTVTQHEKTDKLLKDCRPTQKPHGRIAYSLHVTGHGMYGGYLDVSSDAKTKNKMILLPDSASTVILAMPLIGCNPLAQKRGIAWE
jgi:hypothetical protein